VAAVAEQAFRVQDETLQGACSLEDTRPSEGLTHVGPVAEPVVVEMVAHRSSSANCLDAWAADFTVGMQILQVTENTPLTGCAPHADKQSAAAAAVQLPHVAEECVDQRFGEPVQSAAIIKHVSTAGGHRLHSGDVKIRRMSISKGRPPILMPTYSQDR
jgi:hypothetical protein